MKARGLQFMRIPDTYYDQLREKLKNAKITVKEDLDVVIIFDLFLSVCREESHLTLAASETVYSGGLRRQWLPITNLHQASTGPANTVPGDYRATQSQC